MIKQFYAPDDMEEAVSLKKKTKNSFFLAGGTLLNRGIRETEVNYISLHKLQALREIAQKKGDITIGSMVTLSELCESPVLEGKGLQELQQACRAISINIRNMATIGGCIASNFSNSDIIPSLIALGAHVCCDIDAQTATVLPIEEYLLKRSGGYSPLITEVKISVPPRHFRLTGKRFARTSLDFPTLKVASGIEYDGSRIRKITLAAGGIEMGVVRLTEIEKLLTGIEPKNLTEELGKKLQKVIEQTVKARDDLRGTAGFKRTVLKALIEDILSEQPGKEGEN